MDYSTCVFDKMNPDVKAKWVAELRSGKYQQTKGRLYRAVEGSDGPYKDTVQAGYCCLGVLCEVGVAEGVVEKLPWPSGEAGFGFRHITDPSPMIVDTMPSSTTSRWAGLDIDAESALADMNDDGNKSFAEIADFIEEKL